MKLDRRVRGACGVLFLAGIAGCAKNAVQPEQENFATGLPTPSMVIVHKFAVNVNEVTTNQGLFQKVVDAAESTSNDQRATEMAHEVADTLADELVKRINALGLPAMCATPETYVPANALVITGYFVDIDQGNEVRRLVIGFGAGQSKLDTQVQMLQASGGRYQTLLEFKTHADSGEMPGAAVTMGAGAAAQGAVTAGMVAANTAVGGAKAYRSAINGMASRSADKAASYLSDFFAREGWISPPAKQPLL